MRLYRRFLQFLIVQIISLYKFILIIYIIATWLLNFNIIKGITMAKKQSFSDKVGKQGKNEKTQTLKHTFLNQRKRLKSEQHIKSFLCLIYKVIRLVNIGFLIEQVYTSNQMGGLNEQLLFN